MAENTSNLGIVTDRLERTACPHCGARIAIGRFSLFEKIRCPACTRRFEVPGQFGNFILLGLIGRGGMGAVYLAEDQSLRRRVALKVMRKEFGSDQEFYAGFANEARAAAQLNHVNVAQLYSFGQEKGQPYIVMELVSGERLDALIGQGAAVEEETVLRTAIDVAQGLQAAFQGGLIHGDIKPANILYDESARAKIVDFGLAGRIDEKKEIKDVWGTPYYIAPEKARKKGEDQRSDQYSFGCTLWHALIGRPPFDGDSPTKVVLDRMDREPPRLQDTDPTISPRTSDLVARMMALKPAHRYPTYASLLADLHEALEALPDWERELREATQKIEKARKPKKKPRPKKEQRSEEIEGKPVSKGSSAFGWMVGLCGVAALVFGGWWFGLRDARPAGDPIGGSTGVVPPASGGATTTSRSDTQPFLHAEVRMLAKAEAAFAEGSAFRGESIANGVMRRVPAASAAQAWLEVQQAARLYGQRQAALAKENLERVAGAGLKGSTSPVALGPVLQGVVNFETFQEQHKGAPEWYLDLAAYYAGLRFVAAGQPNDARPLLQRYSGRQNGEPEWAYLAQPTARNLLGGAPAGKGPIPAVARPSSTTGAINPAAGETVLLRNDFESGTLEGWNAHGGAGLYTWAGAPADNYATSGRFALIDDREENSFFTLSQPLPLASKGFQEVSIAFHHRWISPSSTRRVVVQYSANGTQWVMAGRYAESDGNPVRCLLRKGEGVGFWRFTDTAKFRLILDDSGNEEMRVHIDDIVISAR